MNENSINWQEVDRLPLEEALKLRMHAMLRNTVSPTVLQAGSQINVIPSEAEADIQSPLFDTIRDVLSEHHPEATTIPVLLTGGTDAKHVTRLGTKVYGFVPGLYAGEGEGRRVHSHDERVSVRSLQWGVRVLYEVVKRFASGT